MTLTDVDRAVHGGGQHEQGQKQGSARHSDSDSEFLK